MKKVSHLLNPCIFGANITKYEGKKMNSSIKKFLAVLIISLFVSLHDHAQPPPGSISGRTLINIGDTSHLYGFPSGGSWSSSNSNATVDAYGIVTGVSAGTVNIWYYPLPGSYYNSTYAIVTIKDATYLSNIKNSYSVVDVYPNPVSTQLTISIEDRINTITITNLLGQTVYTHKYNAEQVKINVADLPTGIYFVKVNGSEVRKFVKE